jgi:DNA polymerase sigma
MQETTQKLTDPHSRFHQEFYDFEKWVMADDLSNQERTFQKIKRTVLAAFPDAVVLLFGSTGGNLAIRGSDIDIAVIDEKVPFHKLFYTCSQLLCQDDSYSYVEKLSFATVPILKLKDKTTGISADMTFNRPDSYKGVHCALGMQIQFPELRPLYFVLKVFLHERASLDQTYCGGVCSFMLLNMITFYLQHHYKNSVAKHKRQSLAMCNSWKEQEPSNETCVDMPLHQHLLKFFEMFGRQFNQAQFALSIRCNGFLYRREL